MKSTLLAVGTMYEMIESYCKKHFDSKSQMCKGCELNEICDELDRISLEISKDDFEKLKNTTIRVLGRVPSDAQPM